MPEEASVGTWGRLMPVQPAPKLRRYEEVAYVVLPYDEIVLDPFPTPEEAHVSFFLGEEKKGAYVPLRIVNQEAKTVKAALLGEAEGHVLLDFPPTNFGHSSFYAEIEALKALTESISGNGNH